MVYYSVLTINHYILDIHIYIYIYYNYNYISIYGKHNILSSLTINHSISPWYPRCIGCQASLGEAAKRHGISQKSWKEAVQASGVWVGQLTMGIHGNPWESMGKKYVDWTWLFKPRFYGETLAFNHETCELMMLYPSKIAISIHF